MELRRHGFIPHCFASLKHGMISPLVFRDDPWRTFTQLMEADLVYVRDFRQPDRLGNDQLKYLCLIAHSCYASYDLSLRCLLILQHRQAVEAGSGQRYTEMLAELTGSNR